jgi:hypothetical protein
MRLIRQHKKQCTIRSFDLSFSYCLRRPIVVVNDKIYWKSCHDRKTRTTRPMYQRITGDGIFISPPTKILRGLLDRYSHDAVVVS